MHLVFDLDAIEALDVYRWKRRVELAEQSLVKTCENRAVVALDVGGHADEPRTFFSEHEWRRPAIEFRGYDGSPRVGAIASAGRRGRRADG